MKLPRLPRSTTVLHAKYTAEQMKAYAQKCVEIEREECAKAIEAEHGMNPDWKKHLATAIRARGQA